MKIRLFTLGRADISISIGALMVVIAAVLMGRADDLALSMAALSLHEGAHTLAAMAAGKRVGEIELTSVGLCATIAGKRPNVFDELFNPFNIVLSIVVSIHRNFIIKRSNTV